MYICSRRTRVPGSGVFMRSKSESVYAMDVLGTLFIGDEPDASVSPALQRNGVGKPSASMLKRERNG